MLLCVSVLLMVWFVLFGLAWFDVVGRGFVCLCSADYLLTYFLAGVGSDAGRPIDNN